MPSDSEPTRQEFETQANGIYRIPLSLKLVAVLIPLMILSMAVAMFGLSIFLKQFFQRRAELETDRLGRAVELSLRQSMLRSSEPGLSATLADVEQTPSIRRVWLLDKNGRIAHASESEVIGRVLNKTQAPVCTLCHNSGATPSATTVFTEDETGAPILRHVRPVINDKSCWRCHDPKDRLNGILLLEESYQPFQSALSTVQYRLGATGVITLIFLAGMTLLVTTVLVQRPVRQLIYGVRQFGKGDLTLRVPVQGNDELAELASSFNAMATGLDRSMEEIRNKNAELSAVYSILERLSKTIELNDLKEIILQTVADVFDADQVVLLSNLTQLYMRETLIKCRGQNRVYRKDCSSDGAWELPEGFPLQLADRWADGQLHIPYLSDDSKMGVIPVDFRDRRLALLLVRRERAFTSAEANPKLLLALSNQIAGAFENARLYNTATTDELTRLFTRRHFQHRIDKALLDYEQCGKHFALILLDLDHFKEINDRFGHLVGDKVLRETARAVLRAIRGGDSAFRYGGEEFAILLSAVDSQVTRTVAERVRQEIAALKVHLDDGATWTAITASAGYALCPDHGTSVHELVAAADAALYRSKREGRDRVSGPA